MTVSPCCKRSLSVARMASTAAAAVAVVDPSSWAIRCTISAFLIVRCSVFLVEVRRVWQSAGAPVEVAGVLLAWQARYPHGNPAGGKLTIGEVAVSRVVHAVSGLSWK